MSPAFIAIDPGLSGGIAINSNGFAGAYPMDATEGDILETLLEFKDNCVLCHEQPIAYLEQIALYCGKNTPSSGIAKYAENFGFIKGALMALGIPLHLVRSQEWQKELGLGTARGLTKTQWKNKAKQRAQELFPGVKVTLATSDALCILQYARSRIREKAA